MDNTLHANEHYNCTSSILIQAKISVPVGILNIKIYATSLPDKFNSSLLIGLFWISKGTKLMAPWKPDELLHAK